MCSLMLTCTDIYTSIHRHPCPLVIIYWKPNDSLSSSRWRITIPRYQCTEKTLVIVPGGLQE